MYQSSKRIIWSSVNYLFKQISQPNFYSTSHFFSHIMIFSCPTLWLHVRMNSLLIHLFLNLFICNNIRMQVLSSWGCEVKHFIWCHVVFSDMWGLITWHENDWYLGERLRTNTLWVWSVTVPFHLASVASDSEMLCSLMAGDAMG